MGNPKQKWTADEEEALRAGIAKHGTGKWKNIQQDPEFNPFLSTRSNIDLKDKWRNMSVGPGEKSRTPKPPKPPVTDDVIASPQPISTVLAPAPAPVVAPAPAPVVAPAPAPAPAPAVLPLPSDIPKDEAPITIPMDVKIVSKYDPMIFEAITALSCNEAAVVDINAIIGFIERRHELPQNGRKQVTSRLRVLVNKERLEKVQNSYRFKGRKPTVVVKPASPKKEVQAKELQRPNSATPIETLEEAAVAAANRIAEAEYKSLRAADAVKDWEKASMLREKAESILIISQQIYDRCMRGEPVTF